MRYYIVMSKPTKVNAEKLIGEKKPSYKTSFTDKDAILYALGIGFSRGNVALIQTHSGSRTSSIPTSSILTSLLSQQWE